MRSQILICFIITCFKTIDSQYYKDFTTNVYGRQPFECYRCTNNHHLTNTKEKYDQAYYDCGFGNQFKPSSSFVKKELCFTFCMKKEVGIVGGRIDVERRCEPTCQEYNGNTKVKYLVDRVSCCVGNACNSANQKKMSQLFSKISVFQIILINACYYFFYF